MKISWNIEKNPGIIEEIKNSADIIKFSNFAKLIGITDLAEKFILKLKKYSEVYCTLTVEELTEAKNFPIKNEQKHIYKNEIQNKNLHQISKKGKFG